MPPQDNTFKEIERNERADQFSVSRTPFHTHNDVDSPRVSFLDLKSRLFIVNHVLPGTAPATTGNYNAFFVAPFKMRFTGVAISFSALGTDGSAVTLQIEKLTGTTASGSGTTLLGSALNLKGAINTVQYGTLATIAKTTFSLAKGDRLGLKLSGTPTDVANLVVTCSLIF